MRICQVLTLLLVLCDGRPGLSRAQTQVYTAAEGGNITVECLFDFHGNWRIFCKNDCYIRDILVWTSRNNWQNGRYSIHYEKNPSANIMYVSITDVRSSDSGPYGCVLLSWRLWRWPYYELKEFMIEVTNAVTPTPLFPLTVVTSSKNTRPTEHQQQHTTPTGVLLYVGLSLAAVVIMLAATLFTFYWKKRANQSKEAAAATETAQIPQAICLPEDENRESRLGTVSASFCNTIETSDTYSQMSKGRIQTEDSSSKVTYSELDFTQSSGTPRSQKVPRVPTENVLYSTVIVPHQ